MHYDAIIVGSGPNGLSAAIALAEAGLSVAVLESRDTIGGGMRTLELTEPGFRHDICSAIHPMGVASPYFSKLLLAQYGLEWIQPPVSLAHPFDDGSAACLYPSVEQTADDLNEDYRHYKHFVAPFVDHIEDLLKDILGPIRLPSHPLLLARFGLNAVLPVSWLVKLRFKGVKARGLFAGLAAHSMLPLHAFTSSAVGMVLGLIAHSSGWVIPKGGSQSIASALAECLKSKGGVIMTDFHVSDFSDIPPARAVLFDLTPKQILKIMGDRLPASYRRKLERFRYGPGVFKLDYALKRPVPFKNENARRSAVVHLGGTYQEIAFSEYQVSRGVHPERPYVLTAQQSLFDPSRAPEGKHTLWAYCHVPNGSAVDMTQAIENQIERFAPGFRDLIISRSSMNSMDYQQYNENYIGGDINGGVQDWRQLFTRPVISLHPYSTPVKGIYICSSSTPPGGGVHGMCGYHAARSALKYLL